MAAKKTSHKMQQKPVKKNHTHVSQSESHTEDNHLYVSVDNVAEKRKNLLYSLKESLLVQQEYEQLVAIREQKAKVLTHIKSEMNHINSKYQRIKSHFPNVKDTISNVEMELDKIRTNIDQLNKGGFEVVPKEETNDSNLVKANVGVKSIPTGQPAPVAEKKPVSRLGRIENNLKLIEDKLKGL